MYPRSDKRTEVSDTEVPGLTLRSNINGTKTWCFVVKRQGKQTRKTLGRYPVMTVESARKIAIQLRQSGGSFGGLVTQYLATKENTIQDNSYEAIRNTFSKYVLPFWAEKQTSSISPKDLEVLFDDLCSHFGTCTAEYTRKWIKSLFKWACAEGVIAPHTLALSSPKSASLYLSTKSTDLYRYFDSNGKLLYVGISVDSLERACQHQHSSEWFKLFTSMTRQTYPDRKSAKQAEIKAIQEEKPLYNKHHNQ